METIKKYDYILEPSEIREFCLRAMWEQIRARKKVWLLLLLLLAADELLLPESAGWIALMIAVMYLAAALRSMSSIRKQVGGQRWTLWIEDGLLKVRKGNYTETPCGSIPFIRITRRLLMLGYLHAPGRPAWFVMPLRVFADEREQEAFLNLIRNPQPMYYGAEDSPQMRGETGGAGEVVNWTEHENATRTERDTAENEPQAYLRLSYRMDAEKWVYFQKEVLSLLNAGTLGKKERLQRMFFWGVITAVVIPICISLAMGGFSGITVVSSLLLTVVLILQIFFRDPEKTLRKQIQTPLMASRNCGLWQLAFGEEGVAVEQPGGMKDLYAWEGLAWLVETDAAFYLFDREKRRFLTVAKESFQDWDQVGVFFGLCERKGLVKRPPKRMRYVPGWVVLLVFVLCYVCLLFGVFAFRFWQDFSGGAYEGAVYESGAYEYVPLDRQAEVLRSLGLAVPKEDVESARSFMEEYDMRDLVEGSPYTMLLMDMGAPDYDEEGRIEGTSDQVFWFDFEGFDLTTDYIDVLEGMLALAEGSCLDSVTDIREDTQKVDWERGRGKLTVSLDWNGTRYSWDVKVYDDWLDEDVAGMLNTLLAQADSQEYFYVTGDNGQGAIVFFCTEEWADDFTEATGLPLECAFTPAE